MGLVMSSSEYSRQDQIDNKIHQVGTASARLSSSLNFLNDKNFVLEDKETLFSSLKEMQIKISELVDEYEKESDFYFDILAEASKLDESQNSHELIENFNTLFNIDDIFGENQNLSKNSSLSLANIAGSFWYRFSDYMPKFLATSGSQFKSNEERLCAIQIAFEELGEGNKDHIHAEAFKKTCEKAGIFIGDLECQSINILDSFLESLPSDKKKLGIGLGLEIIANENIETLFNYLSYDEKSKNLLGKSYFFKTHFINEDEHIRENAQNFLFCISKEDKADFLIGFKEGIRFWQSFWDEVLRNLKEAS